MKILDTITGKCKICEINLYGIDKRPKIMPCGIKNCPYETAEEQAKIPMIPFSSTGSGLDQIN